MSGAPAHPRRPLVIERHEPGSRFMMTWGGRVRALGRGFLQVGTMDDVSTGRPAGDPTGAGWIRRLRAWAEAEQLQRHEEKLLLVLTLFIGAIVGLTPATKCRT